LGAGKISIVDASGKIVQQSDFAVTEGDNQEVINVARLASGIYTVTVTMPDNEIRLKKLVKN
jgi:hypothetical protein